MIEKRRFGRTGHLSTVTIFGAAALKNVDQGRADQILDLLLCYGVNHIDTAPRYGDAELRIGPWMRAHRSKFFLATKTGERTYATAREQIRRSLDRLQVDSVDLLQLHSLSHPDEWESAMGSGGALEALIEAREEGLTRFIGVTGHGWTIPSMHRRSLDRFDFDSILMPWNFPMYENTRYRRDFDAVCRLCEERDVAVQTIKAIARGPWATTEPNRNTWYQPFEDPEDIAQAVHWVLARPRIFLNTAGDTDLLPSVLEAASQYVESPDNGTMRQFTSTRRATSIFGLGSLTPISPGPCITALPARGTTRKRPPGFGCSTGAPPTQVKSPDRPLLAARRSVQGTVLVPGNRANVNAGSTRMHGPRPPRLSSRSFAAQFARRVAFRGIRWNQAAQDYCWAKPSRGQPQALNG